MLQRPACPLTGFSILIPFTFLTAHGTQERNCFSSYRTGSKIAK